MKNLLNRIRTNWLYFFALSIYIISITLSVTFKRYLYADGAFFLADLINNKNTLIPISNDSSVLRIGVNFINQLFASICLKLNIENINVLSTLFGIPLFFYGIPATIICKKICDANNMSHLIIFPVAAYVFFAMPSEIFIINPAFNGFWLVSILFFQLIDMRPYKLRQYFCLIINLFFIMASHEGIIIAGSFLLIILLIEEFIFFNKTNILAKRIASFFLIICILINIIYLKSNTTLTGDSYFSSLFNVFDVNIFYRSNLIISAIGLILVAVFCVRKFSCSHIISLLIIGVGYIFYVRYICDYHNPWTEYSSRSLITVGLLGGLFLAYIYYRLPNKFTQKIRIKNWYAIISVALILHSLWQIANTLAWEDYLKSFKHTLQQNIGFIEDPLKTNEFSWAWTQPSMSLLLAENYYIKCVVLPTDPSFYPYIKGKTFWIPFMNVDSSIFKIDDLMKHNDELSIGYVDYKLIIVNSNLGSPIIFNYIGNTSFRI